MSALLELSMVPLDKETTISHYVARIGARIRESGLSHTFGPMSCCIEGEWDALMALVTVCFNDMAQDSRHILMNMRVVWRAQPTDRLSRFSVQGADSD